MSQWFGVRGYSMKNSLMNYASKFEVNLNLAKEIAGHKSISMTKIYTKASISGGVKKMANSIFIPGLQDKFIYKTA
jgi:hypothetical protein